MIEISHIREQNKNTYSTYKNIQMHLLMYKKIIDLGFLDLVWLLGHYIEWTLLSFSHQNDIIDMLYQYKKNNIVDFINLYDIKEKIDLNKPIRDILNNILNYFNSIIDNNNRIIKIVPEFIYGNSFDSIIDIYGNSFDSIIDNNNSIIKIVPEFIYGEFALFQLFHMSHNLSNSFCSLYQKRLLSENQSRKMFNSLSSLLLNMTIYKINRNQILFESYFDILLNFYLDWDYLSVFFTFSNLDDKINNLNQIYSYRVNTTMLFKMDQNYDYSDGFDDYGDKYDNRDIFNTELVLTLIMILELIKNQSYIKNITLIKDIEQILIKLSDLNNLNPKYVKEYIQNTIGALIVLFYNVGVITNLSIIREAQFVFIIINNIHNIDMYNYQNYKLKFYNLLKQVSKEQLGFTKLKKCIIESLENLLNKINHIFQKLKNVKDLDPVIVYMVNALNSNLKIDHPQSFFITFIKRFRILCDQYEENDNGFALDSDILQLKKINQIIYNVYESQYKTMREKNNIILKQNNAI